MDIVHLCINHLDFFTPLVIYTVSVLPAFIYYIIRLYNSSINSGEKDELGLVFELILHFSTILTFLTDVYTSKVYKEYFWIFSPVGHGLRKLKLIFMSFSS